MAWWAKNYQGKMILLMPKAGSSSIRAAMGKIRDDRSTITEYGAWIRNPIDRFYSAYHDMDCRIHISSAYKVGRASNIGQWKDLLLNRCCGQPRPYVHCHIAPNVDVINHHINAHRSNARMGTHDFVWTGGRRIAPSKRKVRIFRFEEFESEWERFFTWLNLPIPKIKHERKSEWDHKYKKDEQLENFYRKDMELFYG